MIKNIDIFGTKYTVKEVPEIVDGDYYLFGKADNKSRQVQIASTLKGIKQPESIKELTLMHEIVHCILMEGQYLSVNQDEPLVEWIARCLISLKKQGVFK